MLLLTAWWLDRPMYTMDIALNDRFWPGKYPNMACGKNDRSGISKLIVGL
jgi:hypothetical protein